jgi:hypothetical protein
MQRNNRPIGEVVPALLILFEDLKRLQINDAPVTGTSSIGNIPVKRIYWIYAFIGLLDILDILDLLHLLN